MNLLLIILFLFVFLWLVSGFFAYKNQDNLPEQHSMLESLFLGYIWMYKMLVWSTFINYNQSNYIELKDDKQDNNLENLTYDNLNDLAYEPNNNIENNLENNLEDNFEFDDTLENNIKEALQDNQNLDDISKSNILNNNDKFRDNLITTENKNPLENDNVNKYLAPDNIEAKNNEISEGRKLKERPKISEINISESQTIEQLPSNKEKSIEDPFEFDNTLELDSNQELEAFDKLPSRPLVGNVKTVCPNCRKKTKHNRQGICLNCKNRNSWLRERWDILDEDENIDEIKEIDISVYDDKLEEIKQKESQKVKISNKALMAECSNCHKPAMADLYGNCVFCGHNLEVEDV